ncbi:MAG: DNA replication/repair protein RecF [Angustibacter sp.]
MYVAHLSLTDFRSYRHVDLTLGRGVTALVGPNGEGKTNLIEAVGYVAALASHRVSNDAPLVRSGAERSIIRVSVVQHDRPTLLEVEITPGRANRARINRGAVPRARDVLGHLQTVLFAPEDLALVKGDPTERRRFLDDLLVARAARFAGVRQDYERVVRQRSALLKSAGSVIRGGRGDARTLEVWDQHLANTGAELLSARLQLIALLREPVRASYASLSGGQSTAELSYRSPSLGDEVSREIQDAPGGGRELLAARLLEATGRMRTAELDRGVCLVGPHRDDLVLSLANMPAKGYASHGESWSFALALRLAAYEILRHDSGGEPVLILDDVFAELDAGRRDRLAQLTSSAEQVLVTAAVPQDVPASLTGARVDVYDGEVHRV